MNKNIRNKQRITALTLLTTLLLGGCGEAGKDAFVIIENKDNQLVAQDNSYIDDFYINRYYVLEVYNNITNQNEIYIAREEHSNRHTYYYDVFTNIYMFNELDTNNENDNIGLKYIRKTPLKDFILTYNLGESEYTYEDMQNIYEVIKENYQFENDDTLRKTKTFINRI